jgi:hypothetical protein
MILPDLHKAGRLFNISGFIFSGKIVKNPVGSAMAKP